MDPDACLKELLRLAAEHLRGGADADSERLAELVQALDGWIARGGFLPKAWRVGPLYSEPQPAAELHTTRSEVFDMLAADGFSVERLVMAMGPGVDFMRQFFAKPSDALPWLYLAIAIAEAKDNGGSAVAKLDRIYPHMVAACHQPSPLASIKGGKP